MISAKFVKKVNYTMGDKTLNLDKRFTYNQDKEASKLGTAINYLSKLTTNDFKTNRDVAIEYSMPVGTPPAPYIFNGTAKTFTVTSGVLSTSTISVSVVNVPEYEYLKYEILSMSVYLGATVDHTYLELYTSGRYDTLTGTVPVTVRVRHPSAFNKNYGATAQIQSIRGNFSYSLTITIEEAT